MSIELLELFIVAIGLVAWLAGPGFVSLGQVAIRPLPKQTFAFVAIMPGLILTLIVGLWLREPSWRIASHLLNQTVVEKLNSQSGIELSHWNAQALTNLADTDGFGGGGSVRASSFPVAVLGNIGIIGGLLYSVFLPQLLLRRRSGWNQPFPQSCQSAARWACSAQLAAASVAGSFDLGPPFFIFAGLTTAIPEPEPAPASRKPIRRPIRPLSGGATA
jgi:hypothetical protein